MEIRCHKTTIESFVNSTNISFFYQMPGTEVMQSRKEMEKDKKSSCHEVYILMGKHSTNKRNE